MMNMLIPVNPFSRPGKSLIKVRGLVFHWVNNAGTDAPFNVRWFKILADQDPTDKVDDSFASTHYVIDRERTIRCVPEKEMCYHVGAHHYKPGIQKRLGAYPNANTIGIELCHPDDSGRFEPEVIQQAKKLALEIAVKYGLEPMEDFYRHYDVTGKLCPKHWVGHPREWDQFKEEVQRMKDAAFAWQERNTPREA